MATSDSKDDAQSPSRARPTASAERPSVVRLNPHGLKVDPQSDDAGWDAEAAEALADVYAAAGHPIVDAAAWSHSPWLDTALVMPRPRPPFIDQSWLDDRLTEIARHFESTLLALKPDQAIAHLGQRLDQAENRLTSAVSGLNSAVGAVGTTQAAIPKQISEAVTGVLSSQALTGQIDRTVGKAVISAVKSSADEVAEQVSLAVRTTVADSVTVAIDRSVSKAVTGAVKATSDDVAETISLSVKSAVTDAVTLAVKSAVKSSVADAVADNVNTTVKSAVQDVVTLSLRGAVRSSVADAIADSMGTAISDQISDAVTGALARELTGAHSGGMAQSIQNAVADAVAQSLADVPTKADIDGLYQINGQLNDMLDRMDRTDARLSRLDDLDGEIQALSNRLSDDRMTLLAQSQSGGASQISEADIEHAARTASEQVAREMLARMPAPNTGESEQIHDIRALLETVISEQRQGDEMTSTMLDTLQQAMLTVLDRVDTLEATAARLGQSAPMAPAPTPSAPQTRRGPASAADDFDGASTFDPGEIARRVDRMAEQDVQAQPSEPPSPVQPRRTTTDNSAVSDRLPMRAPGANRRPEPTKEEFISAARRGVRPSQPTADEQPPSATDGRTPSRTRTLASDQSSVTPAVRGKTDRRVLLAVIAVLGLGAGFQLLSRPDSDTVRQAADRPPIAAAAAVDDTVPATSDAPVIQASAPGDDAQTVGNIVETSVDEATAGRQASVAGMLLQTGGPAPTPAEIQALRHREAAAYMSNRTGAQVFGTTGAQTALPMGMTPSASAGSFGTDGPVVESPSARSASPSAAPVERKAPIEMPPATVGPLSMLRAAQSGDPSAQFEVASRMAEARGTPQSFSGAVTWYTRAAEQGFAPAEFRLATMYERGLGVASDLAQARDLYQRAAEKGHVKAMHNLAVLAASKTALGEPDYVAARPWFERAAALGLTDSQFNLAVLLESGLGMTKDIAQAYKWQALAAKGGDKQALKRREVLAQQIDAAERATLDAEVAAWRPKPQDRIINEARLAGEIWKSRQAKSS